MIWFAAADSSATTSSLMKTLGSAGSGCRQ
jgi:hypothetical protein